MQPIRLLADQSVVLVIDVQDKLLSAMPRAGELIQSIGFLLDASRLVNVPILATEQYPQGLGPTRSTILARLSSPVIAKTVFSCCGAANFLPTLLKTGRRQVVVAGMETHVCVLQTVLDLIAADCTVFLPIDALQSRLEIDGSTALRRMEEAGAIPTTVETIGFEWIGDAQHAKFKEFSRLIRERASK